MAKRAQMRSTLVNGLANPASLHQKRVESQLQCVKCETAHYPQVILRSFHAA
jgi:hypothetical protein